MAKKNENNTAVAAATQAVDKPRKHITETVLHKIGELQNNGELTLPTGYHAENALKSAMLALNAADKRGNTLMSTCTTNSIATALLDMVVQGLDIGANQCYLIKYGNECTLQRSYFGTLAVAKRVGGVSRVVAQTVHVGDEFNYSLNNGEIVDIDHKTSPSNQDEPVTGAYAVVSFHLENHPPYIEYMTIAQIRQAWSQGATNGGSPAHKNFTGEMAKKTVINRALKMFVNSASDTDVVVDAYNRTTENEYAEPRNEGASISTGESNPNVGALEADALPATADIFAGEVDEQPEQEGTPAEEPKEAEIEEMDAEEEAPAEKEQEA